MALAAGTVQTRNAKLNSGALVIRGGRLTIDNSKISVAATKAGTAVDINVQNSIGLTNRSSITATALLNFANLTIASISAPTISLAGFSSIASIAGGAVNAGNLNVTADHLMLTGGGRLDANTMGAGRGGDISVNARDILIRDGGAGIEKGSGISAVTNGVGPGGNIHLVASNLTIGAGALVQSSTFGPGAGGSLRVDAATISITGGMDADGFPLQTGIIADANDGSTGPAGNVRLNISGQLVIADFAQISSDTRGNGAGGDVVIAAQNATIDGNGLGQASFTGISTQSQSGGVGGNIVLNIRDTLQLVDGGQVTAFTLGSARGGNIEVNARRVFVSAENANGNQTGFDASNRGAGGDGGDIRLTLLGALEIVAGGEISVSTSGSGAGGNVEINSPSISVSGIGSRISAETTSLLNGGAGGNVMITTNSLHGSDGGEISASTLGSGAGGSIDISAHFLDLNNFAIRADTSSPDTFELPATVSQLVVSLDIDDANDQNLTVRLYSPNFTIIELFSHVGGNGHNFRNTVLADDAPTSIADGHAPFTGRFRPLTPLGTFDGELANGTWLLEIDDGNPDDMVRLNNWSLTFGSTTFTSVVVPIELPGPGGSSNNFSFVEVNLPSPGNVPITPGRGGDVRVHADTISLLNGARISAESKFSGTGGRGGDILVSGQHLNVVGAQGIETGISAKSLGGGASGSVQLNLSTLSLDSFGFIGSSNTGSGAAGSVFIHVDDQIVLRHGSVITTSAAQADAGVIDIESGGNIELRDSSITASAGSNGGSINITTPDTVYLADSTITATAGTQQTTGAPGGTGGNISIDSSIIVLDTSLISANAAIGRGGNIELVSSFFLDSESSITATGTQAGTVTIAAPDLDLSAALVTLPGSLLSVENQLRERCTAQLRGDFSSFITLGRGGTELAPDELEPVF